MLRDDAGEIRGNQEWKKPTAIDVNICHTTCLTHCGFAACLPASRAAVVHQLVSDYRAKGKRSIDSLLHAPKCSFTMTHSI